MDFDARPADDDPALTGSEEGKRADRSTFVAVVLMESSAQPATGSAAGGSDEGRGNPAFPSTELQAWCLLSLTIVLEVCGTSAMKLAGQNSLWYIAVYSFYAVSLGLFPLALTQLNLGTAYAVWSGIGTAATVVVGTCLFQERLTLPMAGAVLLIVVGVVGLHMLAPEEGDATDVIASEARRRRSSGLRGLGAVPLPPATGLAETHSEEASFKS